MLNNLNLKSSFFLALASMLLIQAAYAITSTGGTYSQLGIVATTTSPSTSGSSYY